MNKKTIKEGQLDTKGAISTDINTFKQNKDQFTSAIDQGTPVNITNEGKNSTLNVDKAIKSLGLNLEGKNPKIVSKIKGIVSKMLKHLQDNYEVSSTISENDDEKEMEYGIQNEGIYNDNKGLDILMNKLNKSKTPIVNIKENLNPRIKKQDLINVINKNK